MSGGVDSSVAAALLKEQGYDVTGVFMKPWQPKNTVCLWQKDREDALRAASVLGIPFLTWDFSKEYKKEVTDYMIKEYRSGRTPNPDVMCNKEIKFGLFLKKALKNGANLIATGHYVRQKKGNSGLWQAIDKNKDQSYFLWTLTPKQIRYCLFPIGEYVKPEVRKMAKKYGLPNHDKKDSQGVCFIGPLDMKSFLKNYIRPKPGKIIENGKVIGKHDGVCYYTIGQRHGLDIKNGQGPYYVTKKDIKKNTVYVGKDIDLKNRVARVADINWLKKIKLPTNIEVKIRYRTRTEKASLNKKGELKFKKPIRAITPGQSAVFYRGEELLGGGILK